MPHHGLPRRFAPRHDEINLGAPRHDAGASLSSPRARPSERGGPSEMLAFSIEQTCGLPRRCTTRNDGVWTTAVWSDVLD